MSYLYTCTEQREKADPRLRWPRPSNAANQYLAISDYIEGIELPDEWPRHLLVTAWEGVDGGYREVAEASLVLDVPAWVREYRPHWMRQESRRAAVERLEARNPRGAGPLVREGWLEVEAVEEDAGICTVWVRTGRGRNVAFTVPRHAVDLHLSSVLVTFWEKPPVCWVEISSSEEGLSSVINVERSQVRLYTY